MPTLIAAGGALLERIYDDTWPIWNDGLSRADYERFNRAQMMTDWGAANLARVAWVEGEELLASAKRYRVTLGFGGSEVPCLGIGAVFTPPQSRGRGHAAALIEAMVEEAAREGIRYALLFSEIDPAYYARLGFEPISITETHLGLKPQPREGAPAILVRGGDDRDLADIAAMHQARAAGYALAQHRSPAYARHAITKQRMLAALSPSGTRQLEFFIAEEGASAVAYVVISRGPGGPVLEEWGDRDPTGARLGAILQVLAARTPTERASPVRTWLPDDFLPPQLERLDERPPREVGMLRAIAPGGPPVSELARDAFFLKGDAF